MLSGGLRPGRRVFESELKSLQIHSLILESSEQMPYTDGSA
jgi:hypothetical protein